MRAISGKVSSWSFSPFIRAMARMDVMAVMSAWVVREAAVSRAADPNPSVHQSG